MILESIILQEHFPSLKSKATLYAYCPSNYEEFSNGKKRKTIVVFPGGGYKFCSKRESEPVALRLVGENLNVFVLDYSVAPISYPYPLIEAYAALAFIRQNADYYHVDIDHIAVLGFSAGGHLAATTACYCNEIKYAEMIGVTPSMLKVNACLLAYPVISMKEMTHGGSAETITMHMRPDLLDLYSIDDHLDERFPPTYVWTTADDSVVPVKNSLLLMEKLIQNNVLCELHIYPEGNHGLSLANETVYPDSVDQSFIKRIAYNTQWLDNMLHFIKNYL